MPTMKEAREAKGLSKTDLMRMTRIDRTTISRIEHGHHRPTLRTKETIAGALGVTVDEIEWPVVRKVG